MLRTLVEEGIDVDYGELVKKANKGRSTDIRLITVFVK